MGNSRIAGQMLLALFLIVSSILSLILSPIIAAIYSALFLSLVILNLRATILSRPFLNALPLMLLATLPISIINFFSYGEYRYFFYACFLPIGFLMALLLRKDSALLSKTLFASVLILQIVLFVTLIENNFAPGYSYESIHEGTSSNGFTTLLVLLLSFYLINNATYWTFADFAISCSSLYLCVYGYGRGSVASCILVLVAFAVKVLRLNLPNLFVKLKLGKSLIFLALCCSFLLLMLLSIDSFTLVETYTKFRFNDSSILGSLRDTTREAALLDYFKNLDFFSVLFGNDSPSLYFHKELNGNPHNSFLNSHRMFGIFYILAAVFLTFKLNAHSNSSTIPPEKYIITIVIFMRILTEPFLFGSPLDVLLFSVIVAPPKESMPSQRRWLLKTSW